MIENRINIDQYINNMKPVLIEAFVQFYGEEKRQEITDRFNATIFLGYSMDKDLRSLVSEARKECKGHAMDYFFSHVEAPYETKEEKEEAAKKFFCYSEELKYTELSFYYNGIDQEVNSYDHKRAIEVMGKLTNNPDLVEFDEKGEYTQEFLDARKYLDSIKEYYNKAIEMYNTEIETRFKDLIQVEKEAVELRESIKNELDSRYRSEIMQLLTEEDRKKVEQSTYVNWNSIPSAALYISYSAMNFYYDSPIDRFTEQSDKDLEDPQVGDYTKSQIKESRVEYFKKMGIDLGDKPYEEYMSDPRVKEIYPDRELVERIHKLKESLKLELEVRMAKELPLSKPLLERVTSQTIFGEEEFADVLINGTTCITTNYSREGDTFIERPTLFFPSTSDTNAFDCRLIHECNHAYEMQFVSFDGDNLKTIVGWDECNYRLSVETEANMEERNKRHYEMLNEIINELIAQDICTIMHNNGTYIMGDEKTADNTSHSGYQMTAFLVREFYNTFKDAIIASRKGNNIQVLFDTVGEDNFMELNQLLYDFSDYFKGFKIYRAYQDLDKKKDSEEARYYLECRDKSIEIMNKMKEYNNSLKK